MTAFYWELELGDCLLDQESEHAWVLVARESYELGGQKRLALTWLWLTNDGEVFQTFPFVSQPLPETYSIVKRASE